MKASELKKLILQKQRFQALEHKVELKDKESEMYIEDAEVRKAVEKYRKVCRDLDKIVKEAIAREVAVNSH